jgi:hypothetical protein
MKALIVVNDNSGNSLDLVEIQERVDSLGYDVAVLTSEWDGTGEHSFLGYVYNSRFMNCTLRDALDYEACLRGVDSKQIKMDLFSETSWQTPRYERDRAYEATVPSLFSL